MKRKLFPHHQYNSSTSSPICWSFALASLCLLTPTCSAESLDACDESKCRATRLHPWVDGDTEWTCWVSPGSDVKDLCVDGYEGRRIPGQSIEQVHGEELEWYTCCPLNYTGTVKNQCSDLACSSPDWEGGGNCWADGFQEPMSCGDSEYRHPRWTGLMSLIYIQYVCCTTPDPSDSLMQELLVARIIWMLLSAITLLACSIFIAGILSNAKARQQGYNLYLVFLAIPDALANLMILVRNALTISGAPVHPTVHIFLASIEYFYASSNMWLNAVIVKQIHQVLRKSNMFVKVPPPSVQRVCAQAGGTYVWAAAWFAWAFALYYRGLVWFSLTAVVNVWIVTRVLMVGPPLFYVVFVCIHVWRHKLLPRSGRTRVLSLYFLRVVIVFLVTWVPYFVIYEIAWNVTHSRWMVHISYYLGSVQGFLSVCVALTKPDVKRAVLGCVELSKEDEQQSAALSSHQNMLALPGASGHVTQGTTRRGSSSELFDESRQLQGLTTSVEMGLDRSHQEREERRAGAAQQHSSSSRGLGLTNEDDEWEAEDVWDENAPVLSTNMSAITEEPSHHPPAAEGSQIIDT